jgi:serine protease Do
MPTRLAKTFSALLVMAGCGLASSAADAASWCLDAERDTVTPHTGAACSGRVVDDAEAEQARQRRIERVRRAVGGGPATPGTARGGERRLIGVGTGFFITGDGKLLSNNHVVERCAEITVDTAEKRNQPARLVAAAPEVDLALADTAAPPPAFAVFRVGAGAIQEVATVGFPTQGLAPLNPLLTQGTLVGLRQADPQSGIRSARLEFKADVRGGNSGGPLYDAAGLVIGVVFGELDSPQLYRRTGRAIIDVGFAIPSASAAQFLARHGIRLATGTPGAPLASGDLHAQAIRQVVRVNCWK